MNQYQLGNATVVVYRPVLTKSEQAKRESAILTELQQFGKSMADAKRTAAS